jgi:hypothetical protein
MSETTQENTTDGESTQVEQVTEQPIEQQHDTSWVPKRIGEVTAARRKAEEERDAERARAARLEEEIATLKASRTETTGDKPTGNVEQLAQALAKKMFDEAQTKDKEQRDIASLNSKIGAINAAGSKEFGDEFDTSAKVLSDAGVTSPEFLRVLAEVPNAHKLVTMMGKNENIGEALRIASLDPIQMGIELTKMSTKAAKETAKQISKAPPPVEKVEGRSTASEGTEPDPSDTKAWIAYRNKNARKR